MTETENTGTSTSINFEVTVKKTNKEGQLIDALVTGSKLTKADSGRAGYINEEWLTISIDQSEIEGDIPRVTLNEHSKVTRVEADTKS